MGKRPAAKRKPVARPIGAKPGIASDLLRMYRTMVLIRQFEEQLRSLAASGVVPGLVHFSAGQEATSVGVCMALRPDDYIASHHRGHGHCIAKGAPPDRLMAEILGRSSGIVGGRSGSMHIFDMQHGNLGTNGIVGGGIPLATGAALSAKTRGSGQVAVCFFGDGALNQGLLHECMNMAAIWRLPVIFVCENNGYGEFTALESVTAGKNLAARGEVFDMPSSIVDGMDVRAVRAATQSAVARARKGSGPSFLIFNTYRYGGHHVGDQQEYKHSEEAKAWRAKDPILRMRKYLLASAICAQQDLDQLDVEANAEIRAAVEFARASPEPGPQDLWSHVFV